MDVEAAPKDTLPEPAPARRGKAMHRLLVAINCGMLILGTTGGPLLSRLYYSKGGHRQWLSAWLETGGWPLLLIPVVASYLTRRSRDPSAPLVLTRPRILLAAAALGLATGADDFIYAYGLSYLPVSTSAILISTQLAFTVFFAFLIVRQRLTAFSLNAVALLTIGAVVLGLHASSDRPAGVTRGQYWLGFFLSLGAAALYGLVLPLVELTYKRAAGGGRVVTYALVMEMQLVMGFFATAFCTVGMIVNNDFQRWSDTAHPRPFTWVRRCGYAASDQIAGHLCCAAGLLSGEQSPPPSAAAEEARWRREGCTTELVGFFLANKRSRGKLGHSSWGRRGTTRCWCGAPSCGSSSSSAPWASSSASTRSSRASSSQRSSRSRRCWASSSSTRSSAARRASPSCSRSGASPPTPTASTPRPRRTRRKQHCRKPKIHNPYDL